MAYCPNCGSAADGRFCPKCGASMLPAAPAGDPAGTGGGAAPGPNPGYTNPGQTNPGYTNPGYSGPPPVASAGLQDNAAGALCYALGFITGILFLVLEPYNKRSFVRFHAFQSILFSVGWIIFSIVLSTVFGMLFLTASALWPIFLAIRGLIGLCGFLLWLFLMFKAYNRERFSLPIVGPMAEKQASS